MSAEERAFARVSLAPGERRTIELAVAVGELAYHDGIGDFVVEPGAYEAMVARDACDAAALVVPFHVRAPR